MVDPVMKVEDARISALLGQRLDDGSVLVRSRDDRRLLKIARRRGLVSDTGRVTAAGHRFWRDHQSELEPEQGLPFDPLFPLLAP